MPKITMPDGEVVAFPDTMSETQIRGLIANRFPREVAQATIEGGQREQPSAAAMVPPNENLAGQPPGMVPDVAKSGASGIARGAADLAGLPGSISNALDGGLEWLLRNGYQAATGEAPSPGGFFAGGGRPGNPLSGSALKGAAGAATGGATDYQPQTTAGEYSRTIGEFLPGAAAFGGGSVANLARYGLAPALTSEAAGQATKDTALEPYARLGGALAGGAIGSRIGRPSPTKLPSAKEIKKSAGYGDDMTDMLRGARTTGGTYQGIVRDLWDDLKQAGTSYDVQNSFGRTFEKELRLVKAEGASLHSLERLRRAIKSAGGGALDTPNQAIASRLIDKLDAAVDGLSAANIAQSGATGKPVLDVLKEARGIYRTGKKADLIETAMTKAQTQASGVENGLRIQFRRLLDNPKLRSNFDETEIKIIQQVARGDFTTNAMRWLGSFGLPIDQGRSALGSLMGGGVGASVGSAIGGPVGAAIGAPLFMGVGTAARMGANAATRNQAKLAETLVKAGPAGVKDYRAALSAAKLARKESALRALLQGQSAVQVPSSRQPAR